MPTNFTIDFKSNFYFTKKTKNQKIRDKTKKVWYTIFNITNLKGCMF